MAFQPTSNGSTNNSNTRTLLFDCNDSAPSYSSSGFPCSSPPDPVQRTIIPVQLPLSDYDPNVSYAIIIPGPAAASGTSSYPSTSVPSTSLPDALVPIPTMGRAPDSQYDTFLSQFDTTVGNLNQTTNHEIPTIHARDALSGHLMFGPASIANTETALGTHCEPSSFPMIGNDVYHTCMETIDYTPVSATAKRTAIYDDEDRESEAVESPPPTLGTTSPHHIPNRSSGPGSSNHTAFENDCGNKNLPARERRGNSGASARFRERRREREKDTAAALEKARGQLQELGIRIQELKAENKLLREMLSMNGRQKS